MANWCISEYKLTGDRQELDAVYELMHGLEAMEKPRVENDFGSTFLGCLVDALGGDWQTTLCRGAWHNLVRGQDCITFTTESAWNPANEVWDMMCDSFPSLRYYFYAEEPGCAIYQTNDAEGLYYPNRIKAEYEKDDDWHEAFFRTADDALTWLNKSTGKSFESIDDLTDSDPYCAVHPIDILTHEQDLFNRAITKSKKTMTIENGVITINCNLSTSDLL